MIMVIGPTKKKAEAKAEQRSAHDASRSARGDERERRPELVADPDGRGRPRSSPRSRPSRREPPSEAKRRRSAAPSPRLPPAARAVPRRTRGRRQRRRGADLLRHPRDVAGAAGQPRRLATGAPGTPTRQPPSRAPAPAPKPAPRAAPEGLPPTDATPTCRTDERRRSAHHAEEQDAQRRQEALPGHRYGKVMREQAGGRHLLEHKSSRAPRASRGRRRGGQARRQEDQEAARQVTAAGAPSPRARL